MAIQVGGAETLDEAQGCRHKSREKRADSRDIRDKHNLGLIPGLGSVASEIKMSKS